MFWYGVIACIVAEIILAVVACYFAGKNAVERKTDEDLINEHITKIHTKALDEQKKFNLNLQERLSVMASIIPKIDRLEELIKETTTGNLIHKKSNIEQILIAIKGELNDRK